MEGDERRSWTLLTSHGHVLVEIARNPQARVRDISAQIGITERATQSIIADLERAGYVERQRVGRRTRYVLHTDNPFRHAAQEGLQVGPFLELLTGSGVVPEVTATPQEDLVSAPALPTAPVSPVSPVSPAPPAAPAPPMPLPAPAAGLADPDAAPGPGPGLT